MKIGILSDIHEFHDELRWALMMLKDHKADCFVVLGDVCGMDSGLDETVELLDDAGAVGVWGNHDFGLCSTNPRPEDRLRYRERTLDFMGRLRPRLEVEGCLFTHVEPWLDTTKIEDLWYFDGPPDTWKKASRSFSAVSNRVMFVGHFHRWLLASSESEDVLHWSGDEPIILEPEDRYLVVVHAVCCGRCALFDTEANQLIPFDIGRNATLR